MNPKPIAGNIRCLFSVIEDHRLFGEAALVIGERNLQTTPRIGESVFLADVQGSFRVVDVCHYVPNPPDTQVYNDVEIYLRQESR